LVERGAERSPSCLGRWSDSLCGKSTGVDFSSPVRCYLTTGVDPVGRVVYRLLSSDLISWLRPGGDGDWPAESVAAVVRSRDVRRRGGCVCAVSWPRGLVSFGRLV